MEEHIHTVQLSDSQLLRVRLESKGTDIIKIIIDKLFVDDDLESNDLFDEDLCEDVKRFCSIHRPNGYRLSFQNISTSKSKNHLPKSDGSKASTATFCCKKCKLLFLHVKLEMVATEEKNNQVKIKFLQFKECSTNTSSKSKPNYSTRRIKGAITKVDKLANSFIKYQKTFNTAIEELNKALELAINNHNADDNANDDDTEEEALDDFEGDSEPDCSDTEFIDEVADSEENDDEIAANGEAEEGSNTSETDSSELATSEDDREINVDSNRNAKNNNKNNGIIENRSYNESQSEESSILTRVNTTKGTAAKNKVDYKKQVLKQIKIRRQK